MRDQAATNRSKPAKECGISRETLYQYIRQNFKANRQITDKVLLSSVSLFDERESEIQRGIYEPFIFFKSSITSIELREALADK